MNGINTNDVYNSPSVDPFDRLLQVKRAAGVTGTETHIAFSYPNPTTVTTKQDKVNLDDGLIQSTNYYDGSLRKIDTQRTFVGGCGAISVKRTYDGKGRPYTTSLPHNTCASSGESPHYATTSYDGADRVISVATEDGSATTTAYNANQATVSDAFGAARTMTTDGLGRLITVLEDPGGKNYTTGYNYDVLDNLLSVTQGSLTRTFPMTRSSGW